MRRRLGALLSAAVLPWTVLVVRSEGGPSVQFVFAWGLANATNAHPVSIYAYVFELTRGLPDHLLAWPVGVLLYAGAIASALAAVRGREDPRLTAGLLALAGASDLAFTLGLARRNPAVTVALPVATLLLWGIAWRYYWPAVAGAVRSALRGP